VWELQHQLQRLLRRQWIDTRFRQMKVRSVQNVYKIKQGVHRHRSSYSRVQIRLPNVHKGQEGKRRGRFVCLHIRTHQPHILAVMLALRTQRRGE